MNLRELSLTAMVGAAGWWCWWCACGVGGAPFAAASPFLAGSPFTTFGPVSRVRDANDALQHPSRNRAKKIVNALLLAVCHVNYAPDYQHQTTERCARPGGPMTDEVQICGKDTRFPVEIKEQVAWPMATAVSRQAQVRCAFVR